MSDLPIYEGFPDGVSDSFCQHAAIATSQYGTTARALAAEVLRLRQERASLLAELQEARSGRMAEVRLIRSLQDALTDARDELHVTLVKAKETIRVWHGMGMPAESEAHAWALYQASPEMKQINASLGRTTDAP